LRHIVVLVLVGAWILIVRSIAGRVDDSVAGWAYLVLRRPYRLDDRIQIGEVAVDPSVELAYPTTRTYFHGPIHVTNEDASTLFTDPREEPT
jgi:hypothetical protein